MELNFRKLQGTGNDFVLIDAIDQKLSLSPNQVRSLCDRHFGVGSDGLLFLQSAKDYDFDLVFYNPDGSISFCGNGSRCAVRYFCDKEQLDSCTFSAFDGGHEAKVVDDNICLEMNVSGLLQETTLGKFINTGAPHLCVSTAAIDEVDLGVEAKPLRWDRQFEPVGTNVNFYEQTGESQVNMRTFEKGVEGETLSCGTGVTAVAISFFEANPGKKDVYIITKGGKLWVKKDAKADGKYWLSGPAKEVFSGIISI